MSETTQQRIERINAEAAELENATSDVRQFRKAKLFDQLLAALTAFAEERDSEAMSALKALMPFALEDYYPTCATKDYYEAMERCIKLTGIGTPTPAPSTGEKPE